jgi:hypothetical protein
VKTRIVENLGLYPAEHGKRPFAFPAHAIRWTDTIYKRSRALSLSVLNADTRRLAKWI